MSRQPVPVFSQVETTMRAMGSGGLLLCSIAPTGKPNVMTIGWGSIGIIWSRPVFVVLVRHSRYTFGAIEETGDYTVAVLPKERGNDLMLCGTQSGRNADKLALCGLTAVPAEHVRSPVIDEAVIAYECRVIHHNEVLPTELAPPIPSEFYAGGDYHRIYFGEIAAVTATPDAAERVAG